MNDILVPIVVAVFTGGLTATLVGAIAARRKTRAEASAAEATGSEAVARGAQLIVETSAELMGIRDREIERLEERFEVRLAEVTHELERRIENRNGEIERLRAELGEERAAKERLLAENGELSERVQDLEIEVASLRDQLNGKT